MPLGSLLIVALLGSGSALRSRFEFAGLSRTTTLDEAKRLYPHSTISGSYVYVSAADAHDHIFGIEISTTTSDRLRIDFEDPGHHYPSCVSIEKAITSRHGRASNIREFNEEMMHNRYLTWRLTTETVTLQCFRDDEKKPFVAEAIVVYPKE